MLILSDAPRCGRCLSPAVLHHGRVQLAHLSWCRSARLTNQRRTTVLLPTPDVPAADPDELDQLEQIERLELTP